MKRERLLDLFKNINEEPKQLNLHYHSKVLLVDGMNTFLRSFAASNKMNSVGNHVGGLTGFLLSVGSAIKQINPTRVVIVFDGDNGSSSRKYLYPEYKGNRHNKQVSNVKAFLRKDDEDASKNDQIIRLIEYLRLLPICLIAQDNLEADDIIGHLSSLIYKTYDDSQIYIMSSDNDFLQLVNDRTTIYSPIKKIFYDIAKVISEFEIHPENFVIYKALVGDTSDNIPGVTGIGDKTVSKLFEGMKEAKRMQLSDIYEVCRNKPKNSIIYDRVLAMDNMVEIFYQLVNIREPNISENDIEDIRRRFYSKIPRLQKYDFIKLYHADKMGDVIPNVSNWIDLFSSLNNFQ